MVTVSHVDPCSEIDDIRVARDAFPAGLECGTRTRRNRVTRELSR